ncbi:hypothetical protein WH47_10205 [Habropoda laboriosa]|uniref:Uncharacterized protein n=1 Tax=Habropoda laboriosa TaxID=597456 RepID=A0A0L7R4H0_9HYME|nr:hypothetical protein WH47_10205 [Habropoda laboriosa]
MKSRYRVGELGKPTDRTPRLTKLLRPCYGAFKLRHNFIQEAAIRINETSWDERT